MILVRAQITIHAASRADFLAHMRDLTQATLQEEGCLGFACFEDVRHTNAFTIWEEWRDEASFQRHEQAAHLATFKQRAGSLIASREPTRVYVVGSVETL